MYLAGSEEISRNKDDRSRVFPCERSFSSVPNPSVLFKWQIGYFTWHFIFRSLAIWCLYEFCMVFWTYYLQFPLSGTLDHCSYSTGFDTLAFLGSRKKIEVCFSLFLLPGGIRPDYMTFLPPIWSAGAHWNCWHLHTSVEAWKSCRSLWERRLSAKKSHVAERFGIVWPFWSKDKAVHSFRFCPKADASQSHQDGQETALQARAYFFPISMVWSPRIVR